MKKAVAWIQNIEIAVVVGLLLITVGSGPFGFQGYAVLSGSMEPAIPTGAYAFVSTDIECSEIAEGDVIAFGIGDDKVVTHRVVENDVSSKLLTTKGDANQNADFAPVSYGNVIGETVFAIPGLGYALMWAYGNKWPLLVGLLAFNIALYGISALSSKKIIPQKEGEK